MLKNVPALTLFSLWMLSAVCSMGTCGCSKSAGEPENAASSKAKLNVLGMDTSGLDKEAFDLNDDGQTDQVRFFARGKNGAEDELRYVTYDINFDGIVDITEFFEHGAHVRDEIDLDFDGVCDLIVRYNNGIVQVKEYSVDFEGYRHGIQFFNEEGKRISIHRDTDGDGRLDTVESYAPDSDEPYAISPLNQVPQTP